MSIKNMSNYSLTYQKLVTSRTSETLPAFLAHAQLSPIQTPNSGAIVGAIVIGDVHEYMIPEK